MARPPTCDLAGDLRLPASPNVPLQMPYHFYRPEALLLGLFSDTAFNTAQIVNKSYENDIPSTSSDVVLRGRISSLML